VTERKRGTVIKTKGGLWQGVIPLAALLASACNHEISKAWDSGGKIEAKVSAQTCASATPCPESPPLTARPECRHLVDDAFVATVEMSMVGSLFPTDPGKPRTEIWDIGCDGRCDVAVLRPGNVYGGKVGAGDLSAFSGRVIKRRGKTFEVDLNAIGDDLLTVDLGNGIVTYVQTTKLGDRVTGQGSCGGAKQ
jgi:hypothetical protein